MCPVLPGKREIAVEAALDSSRYFVVRFEDPTGRHAFMVGGFLSSLYFGVALYLAQYCDVETFALVSASDFLCDGMYPIGSSTCK